MSKMSVARMGLNALARSPVQVQYQAPSLAEALDNARRDKAESTSSLENFGQPEHKKPLQRHLTKGTKSFTLDIGAKLPCFTDDNRKTHSPDAPAAAQGGVVDPFEGLPFRNFAERWGEHMMPTIEALREDQKAQKAGRSSAIPVSVPAIPHLLPFTRWASQSKTFESTFIAEEAKDRKKARLSWYHPDDTMVPRDWFRGGLLEDLKYYAPFSRARAAAQ